jgi:hypothetical protein
VGGAREAVQERRPSGPCIRNGPFTNCSLDRPGWLLPSTFGILPVRDTCVELRLMPSDSNVNRFTPARAMGGWQDHNARSPCSERDPMQALSSFTVSLSIAPALGSWNPCNYLLPPGFIEMALGLGIQCQTPWVEERVWDEPTRTRSNQPRN